MCAWLAAPCTGVRLTRAWPCLRSLGLGATHVPHKQAVALRPEEHKLQRSLQRVATRKSGYETRTAEHGAEDERSVDAKSGECSCADERRVSAQRVCRVVWWRSGLLGWDACL